MSYSAKARKRKDKKSNDYSKIQRAFEYLLFNGLMPKKVGDLRKALKEELDDRNSNITLKRLNEFPVIWHPKHRRLERHLCCYGGMVGTYICSQDSTKRGIIVLKDNQGILPFELAKSFAHRAKKRIAPVPVPDKAYSVSLVGTEEKPFYKVVALYDYWSRCSLIKNANHFRVQGVITAKKDNKVSVYIQNEKVTHTITVHDFTPKISKKEFWVMDCEFKDMKLVFKRGVKLS